MISPMSSVRAVAAALVATTLAAGCQRTPTTTDEARPTAAQQEAARRRRTDPTKPGQAVPTAQVSPPLAVAQPPADAEQITGLDGAPRATIFVKRLSPGQGPSPARNDTVMLNFTGWRTSGETFLSTKSRNRPVQQSLAVLAPGFAAAVTTMKKGERAMVWVPPELGYLGPPSATPETTVYEIELVDFEPAPTTPSDVAAPPPTATRTPTGVALLTVKPGDGKTRPRSYDQVTYHYTAWDAKARMFDSTEVRKRAKPSFPFREWPGIEEALVTMSVGERTRVWLQPAHTEPLPGLPEGTLTYELELLEVKPMHAPPPVPTDVAAPPTGVRKTAKGVFYRVLSPGTGTVHPSPSDTVQINYSGWTSNGRLFDSSVVRQQPAQFPLARVIAGWTDGIPTMVVGETTRFWIPVELAHNHEPGRPAGMLVFDIELLEIMKAPPGAPAPSAPAGPP